MNADQLSKFLENTPLFKECLDALNENVAIISPNSADILFEVLNQMFPIEFANINWEIVDRKIIINTETPEQIFTSLNQLIGQPIVDKEIYIFWDDGGMPSLRTTLDLAIEHLNDITCLSTRTWLFNRNVGYVVEWHWCGDKTVGLASYDRIQKARQWERCLNALNSRDMIIYSLEESQQMFKLLKNKFGFRHQYVDWEIITNKFFVNEKCSIDLISSIEQILSICIKEELVYIFWNNKHFPVVKTRIDLVLTNLDYLKCLGGLIWVLDSDYKYILEIKNTDTLVVGLRPSRIKI